MDYIPKKDSEKAIWNTLLSAKIETDGALLGLTPMTLPNIKPFVLLMQHT